MNKANIEEVIDFVYNLTDDDTSFEKRKRMGVTLIQTLDKIVKAHDYARQHLVLARQKDTIKKLAIPMLTGESAEVRHWAVMCELLKVD